MNAVNDEPTLNTADIWSRLKERLLRFFRRRVPDEETAEDLLQETFVRIHKSIGRLDGADRLDAYVFRIARNLLTDHYRQRGRKDLPVITDVETTELPDESGDDFSLAKEIASWMPGTVDALPAKYREAVRMFEIENRPHQEIADALGISLTAAKTRVHRGRELIRKGLEKCCVFERDSKGRPIDYDEREGGTQDACG